MKDQNASSVKSDCDLHLADFLNQSKLLSLRKTEIMIIEKNLKKKKPLTNELVEKYQDLNHAIYKNEKIYEGDNLILCCRWKR